jgi:hypothetical protein
VLLGALSHSGRIRGMADDGVDFAHLATALDGVLRRFGGATRSWRTDRMAAIVEPGSDRLRPEAAELPKQYGVTVAVCPPPRSSAGSSTTAPCTRSMGPATGCAATTSASSSSVPVFRPLKRPKQ